MNLTQDDLDAWRVNPVTEYLLEVSRRQAEDVKADILSEAWESGEINRDRMLRCQAIKAIWSDYSSATADDFMAIEGALNAK